MDDYFQHRDARSVLEEAFREVYDKHFSVLCIYAYRFVPDKDICSDIVHDSFIKLWNRRSIYNSNIKQLKFLYKCIKHDALNRIRHEDIKSQVLAQQKTEIEIETQIMEDELKQAIWQEIAKLPQQYIDIVTLDLQGYSIAEIAEHLGISPQTVKNKKGIALKLLKDKFQQLYSSLKL